jgi:hypothetical protein
MSYSCDVIIFSAWSAEHFVLPEQRLACWSKLPFEGIPQGTAAPRYHYDTKPSNSLDPKRSFYRAGRGPAVSPMRLAHSFKSRGHFGALGRHVSRSPAENRFAAFAPRAVASSFVA